MFRSETELSLQTWTRIEWGPQPYTRCSTTLQCQCRHCVPSEGGIWLNIVYWKKEDGIKNNQDARFDS